MTRSGYEEFDRKVAALRGAQGTAYRALTAHARYTPAAPLALAAITAAVAHEGTMSGGVSAAHRDAIEALRDASREFWMAVPEERLSDIFRDLLFFQTLAGVSGCDAPTETREAYLLVWAIVAQFPYEETGGHNRTPFWRLKPYVAGTAG